MPASSDTIATAREWAFTSGQFTYIEVDSAQSCERCGTRVTRQEVTAGAPPDGLGEAQLLAWLRRTRTRPTWVEITRSGIAHSADRCTAARTAARAAERGDLSPAATAAALAARPLDRPLAAAAATTPDQRPGGPSTGPVPPTAPPPGRPATSRRRR